MSDPLALSYPLIRRLVRGGGDARWGKARGARTQHIWIEGMMGGRVLEQACNPHLWGRPPRMIDFDSEAPCCSFCIAIGNAIGDFLEAA